MANYMFVLRPIEKTHKSVCPACAKRGEVTNDCPVCKGSAVKGYRFTQYYVQERPIQIVNVDRSPETGILRYWESADEYFNETTTPDLNKYVPKVPYGIHFCHDDRKSAEIECERINRFLKSKAAKEKAEALEFKFEF